jgi:hypothetical protein
VPDKTFQGEQRLYHGTKERLLSLFPNAAKGYGLQGAGESEQRFELLTGIGFQVLG